MERRAGFHRINRGFKALFVSAPIFLCGLSNGLSAELQVRQIPEANILRLSDSRLVRLACIHFAAADPQKAAIRKLLRQEGPYRFQDIGTTDRYDNALGFLIDATGKGISFKLLQAGFALADPTYCPAEQWQAHLAAEPAEGQLYDSDHAAQAIGQFARIQGTIAAIKTTAKRTYLNFGQDWKTDFTVELNKPDARLQPKTTILVRGWVTWKNGPNIVAYDPRQITPLGVSDPE